MNLLDFFQAEGEYCILARCPFDTGTCSWRDAYPEEMQFAIKHALVRPTGLRPKSTCVRRTDKAHTFIKQLRGDFT